MELRKTPSPSESSVAGSAPDDSSRLRRPRGLVNEIVENLAASIREGRMHAERPQILTPEHLHNTLMEGFGERAESFVNWMRENAADMAILKYGFRLRKTDIREWTVHRPLETVVADLQIEVDRAEDPLRAIVIGVDEGWEVCLLKFATDLIQQAVGENARDFRRRGLF